MKGEKTFRLILSLSLLAMGGTRALHAAEVGSGQDQARLLLSGRGASQYSPQSGSGSQSSIAAKSVAGDAQEQAREMILGRQIAKRPTIVEDGSRVAGARRDRKVAGDPHEVARLMILGRQTAGSEPRIRLTNKPE
jgi:hypothetical protein